MTEEPETRPEHAPVTPEHIMQIGMGFWASKTLLSACELGLFSELARQPLSGEELRERLGLHERSASDFFDALVALGLLERADGVYANGAASDLFLDRAKPSYVGGLLEMSNARLYAFWANLTEGLRTGDPQNEAKGGGEDLFAVLYADSARLRQFVEAMTGVSLGVAQAIAARFPWRDHETFIDIGGAQGALPVQVALAQSHIAGGNFDLPPIEPIFAEYAALHGLGDRLHFYPGDFFADPLPSADVLAMGHILHDWSLDEKLILLEKAHAALPTDGALIVYDAIIDDGRRENAFGLLMSLNMLIETRAGFDYTGEQCQEWMREVGFRETRVEHLVGPDSMVVAIK